MPPLNIPFAFWAAAAVAGGAPTIAEQLANIDNGGGSGDSVSITFASAPTAGQYIILIAMSGTQASNFMGTPTGFTQLYGNSSDYGVFVKKATGSEGATFTVSNVNAAGILVGLRITGVGSTPLDVNAKADTTVTGSSVTTTAANDLLLSIWINLGTNGQTMTGPSGYTVLTISGSQRQFVNSAHGGPIEMYVASTTQAAAGASGTQVWTPGSGTATHIVTIAVKPT